MVQVLQTTTHHVFPVVDTGADESSQYLKGSVVRYQLEVLLRKRAFLPFESEEREEAQLLLTNAHGLEEVPSEA